MYIDPKAVIGKKFSPTNDPTKDYEAVGYSDSGTLLILGAEFDPVNNRSRIKTFKLTEISFFGKVTTS